MKLAIAGKGGVGKTTISAQLIRRLIDRGCRVLAVDADPDTSLAVNLGMTTEEAASVKPLADMEDLVKDRMGDGAFYSINPDVDDILPDYTIEEGHLRLLKMGGIKGGGTACYCRENSFLNAVMNSVLFTDEDTVVLDMGAGIEHLTRGTTEGVDLLLVVTEPSRTSLESAAVILDLAEQIGIPDRKVVLNKARGQREHEIARKMLPEDSLLTALPYDEGIWEWSIVGDGGKPELGEDTDKAYESLVDYILELAALEHQH